MFEPSNPFENPQHLVVRGWPIRVVFEAGTVFFWHGQFGKGGLLYAQSFVGYGVGLTTTPVAVYDDCKAIAEVVLLQALCLPRP